MRLIAVTLLALVLTGCESIQDTLDATLVTKVVEVPQPVGPDECIKYHQDFPQLKKKEGSLVLPPSEFIENWNSAKKKYRALNKDHSVCRAWHIKRRTQIDTTKGEQHPKGNSS
jgi:hypothetical protein